MISLNFSIDKDFVCDQSDISDKLAYSRGTNNLLNHDLSRIILFFFKHLKNAGTYKKLNKIYNPKLNYAIGKLNVD